MSNASNRQRRRNIRLSLKKIRRRRLWKSKLISKAKRKRLASVLSFTSVKAPQNFTVSRKSSRHWVVEFLKEMEKEVIHNNGVHIDFSGTKRMFADGTILFLAWLESIRAKFPEAQFKCSYPKDDIVEQVLQKVGILKILGKKFRVDIDHETVKFWRVISGETVDGPKLEPFVESYSDVTATPQEQSPFYDGVAEAMSNCRNHAYPQFHKWEDSQHPPLKKWWMFSQLRDGEFSVAFIDLGVGIPTTLKSKPDIIGIKTLIETMGLSLKRDSHVIKAAFELGRSRTRERHRGKGLAEIKKVIGQQKQGMLTVLSGKGLYRYNPVAHHEDDQVQTIDFNDKIQGTLILWKIPVTSEQGLKQDDNGA